MNRWGGLASRRWVVKVQMQLDVLVGMASHLCQRPCGPLAVRAWSLLGKMYGQHEKLFDMGYEGARKSLNSRLCSRAVAYLYVVSGRDASCHSLYLHEVDIASSYQHHDGIFGINFGAF